MDRLSLLKALGIIVFLFLGCVQYTKYIPDPENDIGKWLVNFEQQKSFRYRHTLKTKSVYTEAAGECVIGRGEVVHGVWHHSGTKLTFAYIGCGDKEYIKKNDGWEKASRGEETDIFAQIERLLTFDQFEYLWSETGYLYGFKANIPFLAPDRRKEMIGFIRISERSFLPSVMWGGLPDSSFFWKVELYDYNRPKYTKSPLTNLQSFVLVVDAELNNDVFNTIKKRLDLINIDYRVKKTEQEIIMTIGDEYGIGEIETMLTPGIVNVYGVAENKKNATKVGYLNDDIDVPIFLTDRLFGHDAIKNAKIKFDVVSKPYIRVQLNKKIMLPEKVAFEIDGKIIGTATLDTTKKIDKLDLYSDLRYYEIEMLKARLIHTLPKIEVKQIIEEFH